MRSSSWAVRRDPARSAASAHAQLPEKVGDTPVPSLAPIVKKASPAVVNIATRGTLREQRPRNPLLDDPFFRRFFDAPEVAPRERQFQSAGSGVIVDAKNGYIITNAHVIENADEITVTLLDDRADEGEDRRARQAFGRRRAEGAAAKNLIDMPLADSSQGARSATSCSRSAIRSRSTTRSPPASSARSAARTTIRSRTRTSSRPTRRSIPAIPAARSSTCAVQLVGVNTAIFSGSGGNIGIGFAIPSNMVHAVMSQLVQYGEVKRGMLGVQLANQFTPEIAENLGLENAHGALVSQVVEGSTGGQGRHQGGRRDHGDQRSQRDQRIRAAQHASACCASARKSKSA